MTKETFEDFLMEKHCEEVCLPKDVLVDDFDDWVSERLDVQEIIDYADQFISSTLTKELGKMVEEILPQYRNEAKKGTVETEIYYEAGGYNSAIEEIKELSKQYINKLNNK